MRQQTPPKGGVVAGSEPGGCRRCCGIASNYSTGQKASTPPDLIVELSPTLFCREGVAMKIIPFGRRTNRALEIALAIL